MGLYWPLHLRDGSVVVCRVPGASNSYKAELVGILLGSRFGDHGDRLRLDCQGAILSSTGHKRPVRQAHWVQLVRASVRSKEQDLDWVEGHTGQQFNEASDHYAKLGTTLPPPPQLLPLRGGGSRAAPPPPPAAGRTRRPGLPHDPERMRTPGGDAPATKGGLGRGPQAAPPREGGGEPRHDPPPSPPTPPNGPQAMGAPAPTPPEAEGMIPPPPGRTAAPGREAGAGPAPTPQPPAPTGTTMDKRTRATTTGRHTDRARGQQASTNQSGMGAPPSMARATPRTPALLPAQGRQRDGPRQGDPPPH